MNPENLTKEAILKAFQALSDELARLNTKGELCLFGGTVMVLAFSARVATKDVDAIFQPTQILREAAARVAEANQLPLDWLNDGVKDFVSAQHKTIQGNLPQFPNLRLVMPTPEYLLAMKCMASRIDTLQKDGGDVRDIIFLIRHLNLSSAAAVMNIISSYYPPNQIPVKAQYLVESLFEEERI
ncbi:DUF6036 family nucleotidyltransferase [Pedosphaera parvula]|uniref:Uncharacterized protein n=1 Tax=Pedosphaera parvula (strain Ellin514) TaxID=320771 RepID=B9XMP3_PEDPL|nr:DUF6036 family nucleotidyltransferase [Pedosphaera parvula]EEF58942.1 conserved hypothetical protein [Pedosphaera parvula Ellin514]